MQFPSVSEAPHAGAPRRAAPVIDLKGVTLTLKSRAGAVDILRGIDLSVSERQSVALVGPSGSGKSSLLMVMTGLEAATSGRVIVAGEDFTTLGEDALAAIRGRSIGIVFQSFHLIPTMTAIENVALPLEFLNRADAFERAEAALSEVGLSGRFHHVPGQLSGGEQQRVALARALVAEPSILFADEPTGNLDGETGRQIMDLIFSLHRRFGTTLVLVTHDPALAKRCERVVAMHDGRIAASIQETASA
ncbi:ABC transporter ATP-binding protein [Rhodomicrobium lacus]|uniref:ABC transporter ATP-binding protein n=1 Tax=Rhodomicrobium TaxID=1068 RepID=UPI0026E1A70B|nr:ABC transporter ATP-binding protein [Rhodomicrobium lacus]WKW52555.1 ABC transporter ATP-binding protein [Rhodomicrobium lacus]